VRLASEPVLVSQRQLAQRRLVDHSRRE
jgi:hypothetical protein